VLSAAALAAGLHPAAGRIGSDFANYYVPARAAWNGTGVARIYERAVFDEASRREGLHGLGSFVPHPPANALLLRPMAHAGAAGAKRVWTWVLAFSYAGSLLVLGRWLSIRTRTLLVLALLPAFALGNALAYGQPYPLLLLLISASLAAAIGGRWMLSGALIAPVVVLKLYGLPFLALFVWQRRWRAAAGLAGGVFLLTALSWLALGGEVHRVYAREVLPASLDGRIQDPYSTQWQSASSLSRRLFEAEPDLNPHPAADWPRLARSLARGLPTALTVMAVAAAAAAGSTPAAQWSILVCGALAASPLAASYHFVLLVLPAAVTVSDSTRSRRTRWTVLALAAFCASPLPHHFAGWAHGAANVVACPRLGAALALLALVARPWTTWRHAAIAAALGLAVGLATPGPGPVPAWRRVAPGGYLQATPIACGGGVAWLGIEGGVYIIRATDGTRLPVGEPLQGPACSDGRVGAARVVPEGVSDAMFEGAPARHARLSPDGGWTVAQVWRGGSWDIEVLSTVDGRIVTVTDDAADEVEPSWSADGATILFASDRGRGLGSTAAYGVAFGGRESPARSATASSR